MRFRLRLGVAVLVIASTFAAGMWAHAQTIQFAPPTSIAPTILSGSDVGFRIDPIWSQRSGKVAGKWVVRINGEWVEPAGVPLPKNLTSR